MSNVGRLRFNHLYGESLTLIDGTAVALRLLRADDKELLRRGFDRLSEDGRYNRFFVRKRTLLDAELRYLTEIDQIDHFALVALQERSLARAEGVAVARAVRLEGDIYEGAITVVDAYQGRGLGARLVQRLFAAAGERGGSALRFCVLGTNRRMCALLRQLAPGCPAVEEDGVLRFDVALGGGRLQRRVGVA